MDKQNEMIRTAVKKTLISYEKVRKDSVRKLLINKK